MKVQSPRKLATSIALIMVLGAISCGGSQTSSPQSSENIKNVSFKVGIFAAPTIYNIGKAEGDFNNLTVTGVNLDSGSAALPFLQTGDFAGVVDLGEPPIVTAYGKGINLRIVWLTSWTPLSLVVKPGITDLKGKTIAVAGGSILQYVLEQFLKKHNLKLSDIKLADMAPPAMAGAFKTGSIDGAYVWPPVSNAMIAAGGTTLESTNANNYVVFTQSFINAHPAVVQAVVCDLKKVQQGFIDNPEPGWAALGKQLNLSSSDLAVVMPKDSVFVPSTMLSKEAMGSGSEPSVPAQTIASVGSWMQGKQQVDKAPSTTDAQKLFDPQFAQKVLKGSCK